jgi:hypothetical protein
MKRPLIVVAFLVIAAASSLQATNLQTFALTWSGNTPFLADPDNGLGTSAATATALLTLDLDAASLASPLTGNGVYVLPDPAFVSLALTVANASSGNGTFGLSDFQTVVFETLGTALDYSLDLVGQQIILSPPGFFGDPNVPAADFALSAGTGPNPIGAPTNESIRFIMRTDGGAGDYLQLTSFTIIPEPSVAAMLACSQITLAVAAAIDAHKRQPGAKG